MEEIKIKLSRKLKDGYYDIHKNIKDVNISLKEYENNFQKLFEKYGSDKVIYKTKFNWGCFVFYYFSLIFLSFVLFIYTYKSKNYFISVSIASFFTTIIIYINYIAKMKLKNNEHHIKYTLSNNPIEITDINDNIIINLEKQIIKYTTKDNINDILFEDVEKTCCTNFSHNILAVYKENNSKNFKETHILNYILNNLTIDNINIKNLKIDKNDLNIHILEKGIGYKFYKKLVLYLLINNLQNNDPEIIFDKNNIKTDEYNYYIEIENFRIYLIKFSDIDEYNLDIYKTMFMNADKNLIIKTIKYRDIDRINNYSYRYEYLGDKINIFEKNNYTIKVFLMNYLYNKYGDKLKILYKLIDKYSKY